jgi:hypothetical protein
MFKKSIIILWVFLSFFLSFFLLKSNMSYSRDIDNSTHPTIKTCTFNGNSGTQYGNTFYT